MTDLTDPLRDAMQRMSRGQLEALASFARGELSFAATDEGTDLMERPKPRDAGWEALQHATMMAAVDELAIRRNAEASMHELMTHGRLLDMDFKVERPGDDE